MTDAALYIPTWKEAKIDVFSERCKYTHGAAVFLLTRAQSFLVSVLPAGENGSSGKREGGKLDFSPCYLL